MVRIVPDMLRLRNYRSVHAMVASYVRDSRIRMALSFHPLLIGGNPFSASSIYSLISFLEREWGVHSAMGGTRSIVDGLVGLLRERGDTLRFNADVEQILVSDGRATGVRLRSGEALRADVVVSNADAAWTYRHLVPAAHRRHWTDRRVEKSRYSNGLFVWYFGTDRRYEDVPHHSILLGPRYRGLLDDIFKHKRLAEDFSLYLHRPTATDPSLAPEGCDTFYVLSPVPNLESELDWEREAEPYRLAIERRLQDTVLPGLAGHVISSRVTTPLDFQHDLYAFRGAGFSFEPILTQSAWFRPHNRSEDVEGLYIVGAGTHPGAGVPGVLSSARVLDSVVPHANAVR
jgi:phytoene desaturase